MLAAMQALREAEPAETVIAVPAAPNPRPGRRGIGTNPHTERADQPPPARDEVGGLFTVESVPTGGTKLRRCAPLP